MIAVCGLLYGLLDIGVAQILSASLDQTSSQQATDVIKTRQAIWNNLLFFVVVFAGVMILARAAVQSRQG
jgi:hypothetical protein